MLIAIITISPIYVDKWKNLVLQFIKLIEAKYIAYSSQYIAIPIDVFLW